MRNVTLAAMAAAMAISAPAQAAELVIDGGQLVGAHAVEIDGSLYDVVFLDTSCGSAFSGCNEASDFFFTDSASALAAADALMAQVFTNELGFFDSRPYTTAGCSGSLCESWVAFSGDGNTFSYATTQNTSQIFDLPSVVRSNGASADDLAAFQSANFASFSVAVPEPATWMMMLIGFAMVGFALRSRRSDQTSRVRFAF